MRWRWVSVNLPERTCGTKMLLKRWFADNGERQSARDIYAAVVAQARNPAFYEHFGVPDTVDGRFELVCLHAFLVMRRLKTEPKATKTAQALFDTMFAELDYGLREMGAGDLGVGRRVKTMAKAFYGRISAYDAGLAAGREGLENALGRNVYRTSAPQRDEISRLANYVSRADALLRSRDLDRILSGDVGFEDPIVEAKGGAFE